jgi:hypothetical protein
MDAIPEGDVVVAGQVSVKAHPGSCDGDACDDDKKDQGRTAREVPVEEVSEPEVGEQGVKEAARRGELAHTQERGEAARRPHVVCCRHIASHVVGTSVRRLEEDRRNLRCEE